MRKIAILCCTAAMLAACTQLEQQVQSEKGDPDLIIIPDGGDPEKIHAELFSCINLDYPGLEAVKSYHEKGDDYRAAGALLEYYRSRTHVFNPGLNLTDPKASTHEMNIADQALDLRFYVRNYKESGEGDNEIYYSFRKKGSKPEDQAIDWTFLPESGDVKEFGIQKHRHQWMIPQAKAYRVTRNENYVKSWIHVTRSWWKAYPYQEGKIDYSEKDATYPPDAKTDFGRAWTGLQPAERLLSALDLMQYYLPSVNFTQEWLSEFIVMLSKTADNIVANPETDESSNIRMTQDMALNSIWMLMPEMAKAEEWKNLSVQKATSQLTQQFNEDGVHNELDPSYHNGVVANLYRIHELAEANNYLDLYPADFIERLQKPSQFLADIIWPNYTIDNWNDTRSASMAKSVILRNLKKYKEYFPDDEIIAYMATEGQTAEPAAHLRAYPTSGYYMLKNGWRPESLMLIHKNNYNVKKSNPETGNWHCQNDNGTISIYKDGRCFTPDPGCFTYDQNADRAAFASASIHNTLTRDGADIAAGSGKGRLLKSGISGNAEYLVTENQSYEDLAHRRAIFMVENRFYVIVDEGYGAADNVPAVLNFGLCRDLSKTGQEAEHVVVYDDGLADAFGVHTEFEDGNNMLFRTFTDTKEGFEAVKTVGYYSDQIGQKLRRNRYQVKLTKKADLAARFITVILPFEDPADLSGLNISAVFTDTDETDRGTFHPEGTAVRVTVDGQQYDLAYSLK